MTRKVATRKVATAAIRNDRQPAVAYKVLTKEQFADWQTEGSFRGSPVDLADGYIHLSTADQLQATLDKHFDGQTGLVVAEVDLTALGDTLRWEPSRGGAPFPHVYGDLPLAALLGTRESSLRIT